MRHAVACFHRGGSYPVMFKGIEDVSEAFEPSRVSTGRVLQSQGLSEPDRPTIPLYIESRGGGS